jgi:hypothetical protein
MKKIFLSALLLLLSIELSFSKEVRTRFGFYIDLPKDYFSMTANLDELIKKDKDNEINIDKEFYNEQMSGASRGDLNTEYYFPEKKYDGSKNMIYILIQKIDFDELLSFSLNEICEATTTNLSGLYKKNVKLRNCEFNPNTVAIKDSPGVYYIETDGIEDDQRLHMISLDMNDRGMISFVAGCEIKNCAKFKKDLFAIVNSRAE